MINKSSIEVYQPPAHFFIALNEIGTLEIKGERHNQRILEYLASVSPSLRADEIPWCSAFVNWCLKMDDLRGSRKANARSWLSWGLSVSKPRLGDIVVLWRGRKDSWTGHVGFYVGESSETVLILGGNQSDMVTITPFSKSRILSIRRKITPVVPIRGSHLTLLKQ